jgi:hypothetical protein
MYCIFIYYIFYLLLFLLKIVNNFFYYKVAYLNCIKSLIYDHLLYYIKIVQYNYNSLHNNI